MRIIHLGVLLTGTLWVAGAFAQTAQDPDVSGTWLLQSDKDVKLVLSESGGRIHVQEFRGPELKADYTCASTGKECSIKDSGHTEKTSFWFNGAKLVELRTHGDVVTKRRFALADDGKTLKVENLAIAPPGKTDEVAYMRAQ